MKGGLQQALCTPTSDGRGKGVKGGLQQALCTSTSDGRG